MKTKINYSIVLALIILVSIFPEEISAQCSMCKQAAETSLKKDPNSLARSLNSGILYLMAVPYIMILVIFRKQVVQLWRHVFRKVPKNSVE